MTTPAGVPNLPIGALTVETLGQKLQDQTAGAMRARAGDQMPSIFGSSTGGDIMSDISPFGILTNIWAGINSLIANADPADIQGPEDIPPLLIDFIEGLPFIGQFVTLLEALAGTYDGDDETLLAIQDLLEPIRILVDTIGQGLAEFLGWIWENFSDAVESFLKPVIEFLSWLWQGAPGGFAGFGDIVESVLKPIFEFLHWVWSLFGDVVESVLQPIFTWLGWFWRLFANITPNPAPTGPGANILVPLFTWLDDLWDTLGATILAAFNGLVSAVSSLIPLPTLTSLIQKIAAALTGIVNPQSFVDMLVKIIEYFKSLFTTGSLTDFTKNLPIIGPLVSAITGLTENDGVSLDFSTLSGFFRKLEKNATISNDTLNDLGNKILGGILSIGMLNTSEPNLLSQGDFASAATIEAGGGWSWDNTVSATSMGGALRATATGSLQQIYSRQSIKTATNDKIKVSASVLTSGFTSGSMVLSIIPWIGTVQQTTHVVSTRTSAASTFQPMTGSTIVIGGTAGAGEISLPAGVTSIQVRLAVNANSGAKVWFDDIAVRKTGLVEQSWVDKLPETWSSAWNAVFGSGGAGKTWADFAQTVVGQIFTVAGLGQSGATTANGNITTIIDGVGQAVFGDAGYSSLSKTVKESVRKLVSTLFGLNYVTTEISGDVLPPIDGTTVTGEVPVDAVPDLPGGKITSGTININYLPKDSLGLLGSGASMYRSAAAGNFGVSDTTNPLGNCFTTLESATSDIGYNVAQASFTPHNAGWYRVEMGLRINGNASTQYNICPLIYVGGSIYRRGQDGVGIFINGAGRGVRYIQCSFQVYVNGNQSITAGYDCDTALNNLIVGDPTTTYFGITLLNRSYA